MEDINEFWNNYWHKPKKVMANEFGHNESNKELALKFAKAYTDHKLKLLGIADVVKSLPIQDLPNCTRVEVIDQNGRSYVNWKLTNKVRLSMQDDGRTAKIFID